MNQHIKRMLKVGLLLCFVVVRHKSIYPYPKGLPHRYIGTWAIIWSTQCQWCNLSEHGKIYLIYPFKTDNITKPYMGQCCYCAVNFVQNPHKRHPIAHPNGVSAVILKSSSLSTTIIAVQYVILWWIGRFYNDTWLYKETMVILYGVYSF